MDEGEDLYDDLYEDVGDMLLPKLPFQPLHENDTLGEEVKKKEAELHAKVELLQKEIEVLKQSNAVLTRNISCLFKTAQMELARKDKQMKELRDENLRFNLGGTRGPTNVRPLLNKTVPVDQSNERGLITREKSHHNSSTGANCNSRISEETPQISARIHQPHSGGHRQSSAEGKNSRSPSRELLNSCKQRDMNSDGGKRAVDHNFNKPRSSNYNVGPSDRSRGESFDNSMRHADHGHTKYRSPERNRDSGHGRSRDRRVNDSSRYSDNRKRHRSESRERDVRPDDRESARGSKAINRSGLESSRERLKDHSSGHHR